MKVECVACLSCCICTVIYSAVILVVFLPLQLCETVENDSFFAWLYGKYTFHFLKRPQRSQNLLVFKKWNDILFNFSTFNKI